MIETRVQTISDTILMHLEQGILTAGAAGKLYGRLSATSSQTNDKYGRAKLSPIKKRQYQHFCSDLTNQLRSALCWWLAALRDRDPRPVPMNRVLRCDPVITYSDGEGSCAGVGVAIFGKSLGTTQPRPVYLEVPSACVTFGTYRKKGL